MPLLGMHPREPKTYVHAKICRWVFTAALFIIAKIWKQPKGLSTDEWNDNEIKYNGILFVHKTE